MLKFCVNVFTVSVFAKPLIDLIHVWHGDRNLSKSLHGAISIPGYDIYVKDTHRLRIFMLNFYSVSFCKTFDGFDSC